MLVGGGERGFTKHLHNDVTASCSVIQANETMSQDRGVVTKPFSWPFLAVALSPSLPVVNVVPRALQLPLTILLDCVHHHSEH